MRNRKLVTLAFLLPLPVLAALAAYHLPVASLWAGGKGGQDEPRRAGASDDSDGQAITSFTLHPATLSGPASLRATVTLRRPAPAGGAVVLLSADNPALARLPKSVTVPAGSTGATFSVAAAEVKARARVLLSAAHGDSREAEVLTLAPAVGREWYAAPDGSPKGRGAKDSPWDLATALAGGPSRSEVRPGDTVWLRGGRYAGTYTSTVAGSADAPVVVRAFAAERATLDRAGVSEAKQPALKVRGPWVWFWGLEITNSHTDRRRRSPYTGEDEPWRGSGADVYAPEVKFINSVFHDNGHGLWDKQDGTEVSGCLFYYNGNNKREHALYTGNASGTKRLTDNVVFAQGGYGILAHSDSRKSSQKGLHLEGNAVFNNGLLTLDDQTTGNIQVGGVRGVAAERVVLKNNYVYNSPGLAASKSNGIRLGYEDKGNADARLLDNYVVALAPLRVWWWRSIEASGNTFYSGGETLDLLLPEGVSAAGYRWDFNTYLGAREGGPALTVDSRTLDFERWRKATGLDAHSRAHGGAAARPEGVRVFVRPNRYEAGRAHVVVYNWDGRAQVGVDVSSILQAGAHYEVRDAQNFYGDPVARGTFDGKPLMLPTTGLKAATPVGNVERAPAHTAPEFAVFVILQTSK